jgi:ankyrin repeat protein
MNNEENEKLLTAVSSNNKVLLINSIARGADVNSRDFSSPYKFTPLILSSRSGFIEVSQILIKAGADLNLADSKGFTPLISAAWFGRETLVELFIKNGVKVDIIDSDGNTALMEAAQMGHEKIVKMLLNAGAKTGIINVLGGTALDMAKTKIIKSLIRDKMSLITKLGITYMKILKKGRIK